MVHSVKGGAQRGGVSSNWWTPREEPNLICGGVDLKSDEITTPARPPRDSLSRRLRPPPSAERPHLVTGAGSHRPKQQARTACASTTLNQERLNDGCVKTTPNRGRESRCENQENQENQEPRRSSNIPREQSPGPPGGRLLSWR